MGASKKAILNNDISFARRVSEDEVNGFFAFFCLAWAHVEKGRKLRLNWHIEYICQKLQRIVERAGKGEDKKKDLVVCIPPRMSKSSMATVFLNAWAWTKYPHLRFLTCSYSSGLSEQHSVKTKDLVESDWYVARWGDKFTMRGFKNTNKLFVNSEGGERQATSVGGTVTGAGGDIIIADDLISVEEAHSEAARARAWRMYSNTLFNRYNDARTVVRVVINQRTHGGDVVGHILEEDADNYDVIQLPAKKDDGDAKVLPEYAEKFYGEDGLLDSERLPEETLERLKKVMTDYEEQYNQSPKKKGGNLIKEEYWGEYDLPDLIRRAHRNGDVLVWMFEVDGAFTDKKKNDATAILAYTYYEGRVWARNAFNERLIFTDLLDEMAEFFKMNGYTGNSEVHVEPKANGKDLVPSLIKWAKVNAMESYNPYVDKIAAVNSVLPFFKAGRFMLERNMRNKKKVIKQCAIFPNGDFDDLVDTCVMAVKNSDGMEDVLGWG